MKIFLYPWWFVKGLIKVLLILLSPIVLLIISLISFGCNGDIDDEFFDKIFGKILDW